MPDPSPSKRTRASVPRPRSGCKTCKRRHVKCDETKPECLKCVQTGRKCDGYTEVVENKTGARLSTLASSLYISSYEIPFKIPGSQNDRRIFHYYCVHASIDLAGLSKSDFWIRLVLQCSQDEPVVRSALLALSYEHLDYVTRESNPRHRSRQHASSSLEGLQQHHKAVRQLRRYIGTSKKPSIKAVLVCCILFYHFECSRDDAATALLHLRMGLAILRNQKEADVSPSTTETLLADADMQELVKTLSHLDTQASVMDKQRVPELDLVTEEVRRGITPCVGPPGTAFKNLQEADFALTKLQNWAIRFITSQQALQFTKPADMPPCAVAEKSELLLQYTRWTEAIDAFANSLVEEQSELQNYVAELRAGLYSYLIYLHGSIPHVPNVLHTPNPLTQKLFEQLSKLVAALASMPESRVASASGPSRRDSSTASASRAPSPYEGSGDEEDESQPASQAGIQLRALVQRERSRSGSPFPVADASAGNRSFCAQGHTIAPLFILAAKTRSRPFRDQLVPLLSQISQRREGPWSATIACDVLRRLQQMSESAGSRTAGAPGPMLRSSSSHVFGGDELSTGDEWARDDSDDSDAASDADDNASDAGSDGGSPTRRMLQDAERGAFALTPSAREFASHMLDPRPFCVVAACMRRGYHAEQCICCEERRRPLRPGEGSSLEDVGARLVGGVTGFERLLQEKERT